MAEPSSSQMTNRWIKSPVENQESHERPKIFSLKLGLCLPEKQDHVVLAVCRFIRSGTIYTQLWIAISHHCSGCRKRNTKHAELSHTQLRGLGWWSSPMVSETLGQSTVCTSLPGQQHAEYISFLGLPCQGTTLGDLGPLKCVVSGFQRPEVWDQGVNKAMLPLKAPGRVCSRLLSSFW